MREQVHGAHLRVSTERVRTEARAHGHLDTGVSLTVSSPCSWGPRPVGIRQASSPTALEPRSEDIPL